MRKVAPFFEILSRILRFPLRKVGVCPKESPSLHSPNFWRTDWHVLKHDHHRFFYKGNSFFLHLSHFWAKVLYLKGLWENHPSLYLSHISPVASPFIPPIVPSGSVWCLPKYMANYEVVPIRVAWVSWERWREGFRRDLGGMKDISPILFSLCMKAFPKIMGEIRPKPVIRLQRTHGDRNGV